MIVNETTATQKHEPGTHPDWKAPIATSGPIAWMRDNLFNSPMNTVLTLLSVWLLWAVIPPIADWAFVESVWNASDRKDCWAQMSEPEAGACWAFIQSRLSLGTLG